MRYIREILAWLFILISHAPILVLIAYMIHVYLGGVFHEKIHTSILVCEAVLLGCWILAGYKIRLKKVFRVFPVVTLVLLCVALGSLASYEYLFKVLMFTSYSMCSLLFLVIHVSKRIPNSR